MSVDVDWQIIDDEDDDASWPHLAPSPEPPPRRPMSRRLLLGLALIPMLVVLIGAGYYAWTYRVHLNQVSEPVRLVARQEQRAAQTSDLQSFLAFQDPDDTAWRQAQQQRFDRLEQDGLPEFGWQSTGVPTQLGDVALEPGGARLDFTYQFSVTDPLPGSLSSVTIRVPHYYKQTASGWVRAMPAPQYWGSWRTSSGKHFAIAYLQRDAAVLEPLVPSMDAMLDRVCNRLPCPPQPIYVVFDNSPDALANLSGFSNGFDDNSFRLSFPSPQLTGLPADAASREEMYRAIKIRVVEALVAQASRRRLNMEYTAAQEVVRWELAKAGLVRPALSEEANQELATLLQAGTWESIGSISLRSMGPGDGVDALMLSFALDFLEQNYGEGVVTRMLPQLGSGRVRTLGDAMRSGLRTDAPSLEARWWDYLRNRAGLPAAQAEPASGELALLCTSDRGQPSLWRVSTDGTGLARVTEEDKNILPAFWSPDGKQLAYAQGDIARIVDADSQQSTSVSLDRSIAQVGWLPDGHLRVDIEGGLSSFVLNSDGAQSTEFTGTNYIWSPDATQVAYLLRVPQGKLQLPDRYRFEVWVADSNGADAHQLGQGYAPAWSPDSKRLAFLSRVAPDPAEPTGSAFLASVRIADVASGAVKTLGSGQNMGQPRSGDTTRWMMGNVAWSPDGKWLAATMWQAQGPTFFVLNANTGEVRVREAGVLRRDRTWSPDSRRVAFQAVPDSSMRSAVSVLEVQTGRQTALFGNGWDWSPDGKWLAITQNPRGLVLASADLTAVSQIDTPSCSSVAWRPQH